MSVVIEEFEAVTVEPPPQTSQQAVPARPLDPEVVRALIRRDDERRLRLMAD